MRVIFATSEVSPIAKSGGLGDVCGSLPKALQKLGHDVAIFMPYYRQARDWFAKSGQTLYPAHPTIDVQWGSWKHEATILHSTLPGTDIPLFLIANDYFFNREYIYSPRLDGDDDGLERYTFFCRAVIRACEVLNIEPDIVHAHDWHTALLPVYLHSGLRGSYQFRNARSVYTIHNLNYQGASAPSAWPILGLHSRYQAPDALEHFGTINPMKGGIIFADQVTTVSPNYANEIQWPEHGAGLDAVLRSLSFKLNGILNGIDVDEWTPATDPHLAAPYDAQHLEGKTKNKAALLAEAGLPFDDHQPVLGVVSRLVDQKGFHLLLPILPRLLDAGAQVVLLGSGETALERAFVDVASHYPRSCRVWIGFDNARAHRIYAGSDILLMPSLYEPCGLNQMYALRYGTVPVVRMTGGLRDTVTQFDGSNLDRANGFGFDAIDPSALFNTTWIAMLSRQEGTTWKVLQQNGMKTDFSWERSARDYEFIYRRALS
jgi:starch synthase